MDSWTALTIAEQTLMRRAISGYPLAGTIQDYGAALRWAGASGAVPRGYTEAEQRALTPQLAAVALDLAERQLLTVHETSGRPDTLSDRERRDVLADPAHWLWNPAATRTFELGAPQPVREHWFSDANPVVDTRELPTWDELTVDERAVLVCAAESSGMLTGSFGIWPERLAGLDAAARREQVDRELAPLLPFVRAGWIEVRHHPDGGEGYTVIPLADLDHAFADPAVRNEGGDWGIGIGCVFTYAGLAVWRGGSSTAWAERLTLD
ncbi:hypothetical protein R8Z50_21665 [Longispora sp. K20-0274]|uniref:hypothetical protein n=1 Tax=Longispora sp. K20-0274 TaxID=3088255 RepID=UPI00399AE1A3